MNLKPTDEAWMEYRKEQLELSDAGICLGAWWIDGGDFRMIMGGGHNRRNEGRWNMKQVAMAISRPLNS